MKPYNLRIENSTGTENSATIIDTVTPEISWAVSGHAETIQGRVEVWHEEHLLWQSVFSDVASLSVRYSGPAFTAGEAYLARVVYVQAKGGECTTKHRFCYGVLTDWNAAWITKAVHEPNDVLYFYKDFTLSGTAKSACLFLCGIGFHYAEINGEKVFAYPLNPISSEYDKRVYYNVVPGIADILKPGRNRICIAVSTGWRSSQNVCYELTKRIPEFTGETELRAQLQIRMDDGVREIIGTDSSWNVFRGPIVASDIFDGEIFDASMVNPPRSESNGELCIETEEPCSLMTPQLVPYVSEQEHYVPKVVTEVERGVYQIDFGQNLAGVCKIRIPGLMQAGDRIQIRHAEEIDESGRLFTAPLRNAQCTDTYIASGNEDGTAFWQPYFTYHGFRYVEVSGYPTAVGKDDMEAIRLYSDIRTSSFFKCGNALVNEIYDCAIQTELSNIQGLMTDCPQRDERMGWLNDYTARLEALSYDFDTAAIYKKLVRDCLDTQAEDGSITCTAPFAFGSRPADPVCSSFLIAGMEHYFKTEDPEVLREGYPGFCRWNQLLGEHSDHDIVNYSYYGDWAAPDYACVDQENAVSAVTPGVLISTGYYYYNARLLTKMADVLGYESDSQYYRVLAEKIQAAFLQKWFDEETDVVGTGSQACYAFALWLDILPPAHRERAARNLRDTLVRENYRITTGNLCTRYLFEELTRYGYVDDAWKLITSEDYPSFGYMLQNMATTIWERFELKKNPTMNSHNHPMYGSVRLWFYKYLAGLQHGAEGWRDFIVQPYIPSELLYAEASVATKYGDIHVLWRKEYRNMHLFLTVPTGTKARVFLPWGDTSLAEAGTYHWSHPLEGAGTDSRHECVLRQDTGTILS
ncbi:alpha-L-rhamnosidase [Lachnoclostridium sp. Marseille-P6806]|uniref:alpha-L-rhamnosidase n=1 Tax=Lachnoclostridium sp. Marseille-P6806 TaxID=2364793 RepID=UPI0010309E9C|nr:alpha-L-rhamnosidase [Lachnoclostridium sp. Marseille-P6806]